ncbi:hypothetical protein DSO57_1033294 [Entomophthora muscae]|uniref:Uncharacterized protein n=1 Tax=Entomophthora muscae TaxID=34485 RepID=A0ACC2RR49_9FUNG|nr:hypothetical protein DSO57_1033294 [Entomophthora muscae]
MNDKDHIPLGDPASDKAQLLDYHLGIAKQIEDKVTGGGSLYFKTLKKTKSISTPMENMSVVNLYPI